VLDNDYDYDNDNDNELPRDFCTAPLGSVNLYKVNLYKVNLYKSNAHGLAIPQKMMPLLQGNARRTANHERTSPKLARTTRNRFATRPAWSAVLP
jgi:hypothetical protein